jgi:hypothetical protein
VQVATLFPTIRTVPIKHCSAVAHIPDRSFTSSATTAFTVATPVSLSVAAFTVAIHLPGSGRFFFPALGRGWTLLITNPIRAKARATRTNRQCPYAPAKVLSRGSFPRAKRQLEFRDTKKAQRTNLFCLPGIFFFLAV